MMMVMSNPLSCHFGHFGVLILNKSVPPGGDFLDTEENPMVQKLKRIPSDLVSYVQIEGEAIKDANDKQIIVAYAYSKLELIDWYIELLDVGSKKYIVPQSRNHLVGVKNQLESAIKKIMDTPLPKTDRAIISINYPKGYEG